MEEERKVEKENETGQEEREKQRTEEEEQQGEVKGREKEVGHADPKKKKACPQLRWQKKQSSV